MIDRMEITIGSVPDKKSLVAEFWNERRQWGELSQEDGTLIIEIYPPKDGNSWVFEFDELVKTLKKGKQKLIGNYSDKY